ncbi:DUF1289 domain-containing protein (plasmid) [Cereibacter azotoformans]|uniref:DUF1289 domain-containing protein n=1 Tax=Cereibacter azotoformans TaxID=43057 RepID=UPI001EEBC7DB|nr:DUF1289 domain-containing protein [Cereibacter azotoformans]ULB12374.1 DUF1289 domain-containing protein [Cereibacter azotoformans]
MAGPRGPEEASRASLTSPCTGLCKLDPESGFCLGCARSGEEIGLWGSASEAERAAIWNALPARFDALGIACRRLPLGAQEIHDFLITSLAGQRGTWVMGVPGAVAEFAAAPGETVRVRSDGATITAVTPGGRLRLLVDDAVRALSFDAAAARGGPVVLAVTRERARPPLATRLSDAGPDAGAIDPADRADRLIDLGLGRKEARFCVRCASGAARDVLCRAEGLRLPDSLPVIAPVLIAEGSPRVVETALGRIEVTTPIPPPDGRSPAGPHTHLLPEHLAKGRPMPPGMDLPRAWLPGAIFYPDPRVSRASGPAG